MNPSMHALGHDAASRPVPVWNVVVGAALLAGVLVYAGGVWRLWRRAGRGHGVTALQMGAYLAAAVVLWAALVSRFDAVADVLFSAHMGQHELLMLICAPLVVLSRPLTPALWTLPDDLRRRVVATVVKPRAQALWHAVTHPVLVLVLHGVVLWIWHVPALFEHALAHESLHAFQHFTFFITAVLFWWALAHGRYGRAGYGAAVVFVFATVIHSGLLGAMLTFAGRGWYPTHQTRTAAVGLDPLADQQLAGLLMWVPAGVLMTVLALGFLSAWLGEAERRAAKAELR